MKQVTHDPHAAGHVDHVGFKTNQSAHGNERLDHNGVIAMLHILDIPLAVGQAFHDRSHMLLRGFEVKAFDRLQKLSLCIALINDLRSGNEDLKPLAPHLFHQDGNLHFSSGGHIKQIGSVGFFHPQGDVGARFAEKSFLDVPSGDQFAVGACKGPIVDGKLHANSWRVDWDEW